MSVWRRLVGSPHTQEVAIVGIQVREARELAAAAETAGLAVRPLEFGSPLADAALAAHGPGAVRLPLAIVDGRYSLQRPTLGAVLECIDVVRGSRPTLPAACVVLKTVETRESSESGDDPSPDGQGISSLRPRQEEADTR